MRNAKGILFSNLIKRLTKLGVNEKLRKSILSNHIKNLYKRGKGMKKTKILMTTLAVATLAVGCGVLAACGGNEDTAYDITFDANGGTYAESATTVVVKTDKDGRIAQSPADPTREGGGIFTFNGYNTVKEGTGDAVTFGAEGYQFKSSATVYAQWKQEYQLTLNAGEHGLFGTENTANVVTVDG